MNKKRAIWLATLSGLAEPIGAIVGAIMMSLLGGGDIVTGTALAFAAGVMVYITIDELIPVAHEFCTPIYKYFVSSGVLCGIIFAQLISIIV
jgi:zinc transporter ZupT